MSTKGWEGVTRADVTRRELAKGTTMAQKPRSKYGAVKTTVDGITFDSAKEAKRYGELKLLVKAGAITCLRVQPRFPLHAWTEGRTQSGGEVIGEYRGDFSYQVTIAPGFLRWVIEDVKGCKTPLYKWKKRHVEAQYGIVIQEI